MYDRTDRRDVFISHSSKDRQVASEIIDRIEAQKVTCWIAQRDIRVGTAFAASVYYALEAAPVFVVLLSADANASDHVIRELTMAIQMNKRIVPVKLEEFESSGSFAYYTAGLHFYSWSTAAEEALSRIAEQVTNARTAEEPETLRIPGHAAASQEAGVRAFIAIEVAENLSELRRFKDKVASAIKFKSSPMANVDRGNALKQTSPPKFKRHYWDTLTTSIASSLSNDEIKNAHIFYVNLDRLAQLLQTKPDRRSKWRKDVDGLIEEILGNANPLTS